MNRKKVFLIVQSVLCVLLAVLLIAAVIGICREGVAAKAENPLAQVFSREKVTEHFRPIRPLLYITLGMAAVGLILDVKDENSLKPAKGGKVENPAPPACGKTLRTVLLIAAVCLLAAGVFNGSAQDVFGKAVRICTECVGLG